MTDLRFRRATFPCLTLVAGLAATQGAWADHPCGAIADDPARLACYDAAFGRAATKSMGTGLPAASEADAAAQAKKEFGLSESDKRALDPARAGPTRPDSIAAKVAAVSKRPTGEWVVTLEDGQVWAQAESDTRAMIRVGDEVTVRRAALGSYVLVSANRVAMRVRRIK